MRWMLNAKCRQMDPKKFHVENLTPGRETIEAKILCAGCTVVAECAQDALEAVNVSLIIREVVGVDLPEAEDFVPTLGVVRAAVVC